jgi:hypothetical protein
MGKPAGRRVPALMPVALGVCLLLSGCDSIGPPAITRDRLDYNQSVSRSWQEQTLLNIVKLRYADMPLFMEVSSIISGYTLESTVSLSAQIFEAGTDPAEGSLGGSGKYIDRPTITFTPLTGRQFNKVFLRPISPGAVLSLVQAGWPANYVLPLSIASINGLNARGSTPGDPDFYRVFDLIAELKRLGRIDFRIDRNNDAEPDMVMVIRRPDTSPNEDDASVELTRLLGIRWDAGEYKVIFGELPADDSEIAIRTRSPLEIMILLGAHVDVPDSDIASGRTVATAFDREGDSNDQVVGRQGRLIAIRTSEEAPEDAFVSVQYRNRWFWIDDRDFASKRTFGYLMILFSLTEAGDIPNAPQLTIPAN